MREFGLIEWSLGLHFPKEDFWMTVNLHDIPNTMAKAILALPSNCKKANVVRVHREKKLLPVINAAKEKNIEINWKYEDNL